MTTPRAYSWLAGLLLSLGLSGAAAGADEADLILHHGKVVTVDRDFSVRQALAVRGGRLLRVGTDEEVLLRRCNGRCGSGLRSVRRGCRSATPATSGGRLRLG